MVAREIEIEIVRGKCVINRLTFQGIAMKAIRKKRKKYISATLKENQKIVEYWNLRQLQKEGSHNVGVQDLLS